MISKVLLCTDGSAYADVATDYAVLVASKFGARIRALHALDIRLLEGPFLADLAGWLGADAYMAQLPAFRELMEKKGASILSAVQKKCENSRIPVETTLKAGHPVRVILEEAANEDLVVLGQRGEHAEWSQELSGSVMDKVTRRLAKPVLVTTHEFRPIRRILVAYDGSAHARNSLAIAAEWARALEAPIVLVSVAERAHLKDSAVAAMEEGRRTLEQAGMSPESCLCLDGAAGRAILGAAQERMCDLIIMGTFGHSKFRDLVLGSTAAHILHHARQPVLLAP